MTRTQDALSFGWITTNSATWVDTRHRNDSTVLPSKEVNLGN